MTTRNITVDGITIPVTDQGAQAIEKLQAQLASKDQAIADAKKALDDAADAVKKMKEDHKKALDEATAKIPTADQLEEMLTSRSTIIAAADKLMPGQDWKGKTANDVRKAVVASKLGDAAVKDKGAEHIAAQFDTLATLAKDAKGSDPIRDAISSGLSTSTTKASDARAKMLEDQAKAWAA